MATVYPYYVICWLSGGLLVKLYRGKKFRNLQDAYKAFNRANPLPHSQLVMLEYVKDYTCRIIAIRGERLPLCVREDEEVG